jgi:hypothetical protein
MGQRTRDGKEEYYIHWKENLNKAALNAWEKKEEKRKRK